MPSLLIEQINNDYARHYTLEVVIIWLTVSRCLFWAVTVVSIISIVVLVQALFLMLTRYKRSNYFDFITTMIVLDLIMLTTILLNLLIGSISSIGLSFISFG